MMWIKPSLMPLSVISDVVAFIAVDGMCYDVVKAHVYAHADKVEELLPELEYSVRQHL